MQQAAATKPSTDPERREVEVAILGCGFSGLATAIRLKQEGVEDFVVLDRAEDVGGTWHWNTYPGCACDVPSHLYSLSFAPNPEWSRTYSLQPEIRSYLRRTADEFGIRPYIRFNCDVSGAHWDEDQGRWVVETSQGEVSARVLVAGLGPLFEPRTPDIPGLDSFAGPAFHSARWDHDVDLKGKRVATIGTGASAIQFVPEIQPEVEELHVFQRSAPWIVPHSSREVRDFERRLYRRFPGVQRLVRGGIYSTRELLALGFVKRPRLMKVVEAVARRHMRSQLQGDPELIRKATPNYTIGCKRILPSNKWYPALTQPNVDLVTDPIKEVRPGSIVTADGTEREVDVIIYGTGFHVTDMPIGRMIRGRDGQALADSWNGSPKALAGTAFPGFPNLFMLLGPNTGLGHTSMVYMLESQLPHVLDAVRLVRERDAEIEARENVVASYNEEIDERMAGTVWNTGCASWYQDATGRNSTQWPDWTWRFRQRNSRLDESDYLVRRRTPFGEEARVEVAA